MNKQVFIFPRALKENVGKKYAFNDHQKVKAFIKKDFLVNPVHQIALNKEAFTELIIIKDQLSRNIVDIIENFFTMINENCINSDNSTILKEILEIMHLLLDIKISTVTNYCTVIQKIFTSTDQLNSILQQIEEIEPVISFIDRIYQNDEINSYFKQTFIKSTQSEIKKLEVAISNLEKREKQAELIKEKQKIIQKYKVIEEKNQKLVYKNDQLEKQIKSNDVIINKLQQQLESQKKEANQNYNKIKNELSYENSKRKAEEKENREKIIQMQNKIKEMQKELDVDRCPYTDFHQIMHWIGLNAKSDSDREGLYMKYLDEEVARRIISIRRWRASICGE